MNSLQHSNSKEFINIFQAGSAADRNFVDRQPGHSNFLENIECMNGRSVDFANQHSAARYNGDPQAILAGEHPGELELIDH